MSTTDEKGGGQDSMAHAEEAIAVARARLSANVGTFRRQAGMIADTDRPVVTLRSSGGSADAVDLAAMAIRAAGTLYRGLNAALRRPVPLMAVAGATIALLRRRQVRRRRRRPA